jgi:prevent-host-death family protein
MLDLSRDIDSLSNFKRNSVAFIDRLKQTGAPVVLTVHGKAEIVVQDAKSYQRLLEAADYADAVEGIRAGQEDVRMGRTRPMEDVLEELGREYETQG